MVLREYQLLGRRARLQAAAGPEASDEQEIQRQRMWTNSYVSTCFPVPPQTYCKFTTCYRYHLPSIYVTASYFLLPVTYYLQPTTTTTTCYYLLLLLLPTPNTTTYYYLLLQLHTTTESIAKAR